MTIFEAMEKRHAVRSFYEKEIDSEVIAALNREISSCNAESSLNIQLLINEPEAFSCFLARYGKFNCVRNYIALIGEKGRDLDEKAGYYGQRIALVAQQLGLNSCWVALSYSKSKIKCEIGANEHLACVIALGYGRTQGIPHKNKPMERLCKTDGQMPDWFRRGMEAALLAPTATNQQRFLFTLKDNLVKAESTGGFYDKIDLGIVKYHFEIGAGEKTHGKFLCNSDWIQCV